LKLFWNLERLFMRRFSSSRASASLCMARNASSLPSLSQLL
jgi:hypothetical protein